MNSFTHRCCILFILSEWLWKHKNQQYFVGEKVEGKCNHTQLEDEPQIGGVGTRVTAEIFIDFTKLHSADYKGHHDIQIISILKKAIGYELFIDFSFDLCGI
jgi:hypothetical protein